MNTRILTDTEIRASADRLTARGEKVTLRAVRAELGGGSYATIHPALAAWKEKRPRIETTSHAVPPELQRAIASEIERCVAAARAELAADLSEAHDTRDALAEELQQQITAALAAEKRTEEADAEVERHAGTITLLERNLTELREQFAREREAAENARKAAAIAELRLESLPQMIDEIKHLRAELAEERHARRIAEVEAAELRGARKKGGS
jgi:colicin import membrane protein